MPSVFAAPAAQVHPAVAGRFELWLVRDMANPLDIKEGDLFRMRTAGYIADSAMKVSGTMAGTTSSNFTGGSLLDDWSSKLAAAPSARKEDPPPDNGPKDVEDDEWD